MNVFVTDDHAIIFGGFKKFLSSEGHKMVGTAKSGKDLLTWLESNTCDLIILDLYMPEMSGLEVLKILSTKENVPKILIYSGFSNVREVQECIFYGAKGFVLKSDHPDCLSDAIRRIGNGKKYFSKYVMDAITLKQLETKEAVTVESLLSKRENEALVHITNSLDTKEICK